MKASNFKIGMTIWLEVLDDERPRWDYLVSRGPPTGKWRQFEITDLNIPMCLACVRDGVLFWNIPLPGEPRWRPGVVKLIMVPPGSTIYRMTVPKHQIGSSDCVPDHIMKASMGAAQSWVKRNVRSWPYDKELSMSESKQTDGSYLLEFFWIDKS